MTETGFGDLLRRHRIAANLTQEALAERAGLSARGISDLERGARELPRKDTLRLLLQALDLSQVDRAAMIAAARRPPVATSTPSQAGHAAGLPILTVYQGDLVAARRAAIEGLALARAAGEPLLAALGPFALCVVEEYEGRRPFTEALIVEAVAAARAARHPGTLGWTLQAFGRRLLYAGDLDAAQAAFDESLALFQACDGIWGTCDSMISLAWVARAQGDLAGAARHYAASLRLRQESGLLTDVYGELLGVSGLALLTGNTDAAVRLLGADNAYIARSGYGYEGLAIFVPRPERMRQELLEQLGVDRFERSWAAGQALAIDEAVEEALALADDMATLRS